MANDVWVQNDFSVGEISPNMLGRIDTELYPKALAKCRNLIVLPSGGVQKRPGTLFLLDLTDIVSDGGEWNELPTYSFTIRSDVNNLNLFTLAGRPTDTANYVFTINAGVVVGADSPGAYALETGVFPNGAVVLLNIKENACISGAGGNADGGVAGKAIKLGTNISIDNRGTIQSGGAGGVSGVGDYVDRTGNGQLAWCRAGRGGGGGGAGRNSGKGAAGGASSYWVTSSWAYGALSNGGDGGDGTVLSGGKGGKGGYASAYDPYISGTSGTITAQGTAGTNGGDPGGTDYITLNGFTVTWINTGVRLGTEGA